MCGSVWNGLNISSRMAVEWGYIECVAVEWGYRECVVVEWGYIECGMGLSKMAVE